MAKNYFFILLFVLTFLIPQKGLGQDNVNTASIVQDNEELTIYPNPVASGKSYIFINSKLNSSKKIEFYNVLGKRIYSTIIIGRELNISNLNKGVYIVKVTEKDITHIRKLIIK